MNFHDRRLAISGGTLHHIGLLMQAEEGQRSEVRGQPEARCAWCDEEAGRKPSPGMNESHGICARHLAAMKSSLDDLRRMAA